MELIVALALQALQMMLALALAPLVLGFTRVLKARLLRRRGPPLFQPYRDLLKLSQKEAALAPHASWLYRAAPYAMFATLWTAAGIVPTYALGLMFSHAGDIIALTALLGAARFFLSLAGMDIGTSFGGIGASREAMFASFAEPAMIMIAFSLALVAGSTQLVEIAAHNLAAGQLRVTLGLSFVALVIVALAENARIPVDNPATHLELTMVHEAMALDYSGRHLALIEWAAALKLVVYLSILACVFAPFGVAAPGAGAGAIALGLVSYVAKIFAGAAALVVLETSIAKLRVFRVPDLLGAALMLGLLGALLAFVSRSL
jgi:formate hydrogenlyase subunit 4